MLGLQDNSIFFAYILSIASALICVLYGILNWNRGADNEADEIRSEQEWENEEEAINETL